MRLPKITINGIRFRADSIGPEAQCNKTQRANYERRMKAVAIACHAEEMYKMLIDIGIDRDVDWFDIDQLVGKVTSTYKGLIGQ